MKVMLLSYEDGGGGAGRAALKLHGALRENEIDSVLRVARKTSDLPSIIGPTALFQRISKNLNSCIAQPFMRLQRTANRGLHSPAWLPTGIVAELNNSDADVVQLNWVCGLLTVEEIGRLTKPLVWRLSDMWAFSGTEHYGEDGPNARWRTGYHAKNRPATDSGLDIARWAWNRKLRAWRNPIHIVAPSRWLADCVKQSALMRDWPVSVIPTVVDTNRFQPWPKAFARELFRLPQDIRLILFGALAGGTDPRKGREFLESALAIVAKKVPRVAGVIFGQSEPLDPPRLGLPLYWTGHLSDDITLSLLYSAADVMVLPSRQDNLPQTGIEAQCCGCPVVTFDCSGLPDLLEHKNTGYLARAFDVDELAFGIEWVLESEERQTQLSRASRVRSLQLWAPSVVIPKYLDVYRHAIDADAKRANAHVRH